MSENEVIQFNALGNRVSIPSRPDDAVLEWIPWDSETLICARFTCPEFSSLCPITGAPDFGRIIIDYVPDQWLIESKSLKLFLNSFRNEGMFHEKCTDMIGNRLFIIAKPKWMRVSALFMPRGGIPVDIFWQKGEIPQGVCIPDLVQDIYRGR